MYVIYSIETKRILGTAKNAAGAKRSRTARVKKLSKQVHEEGFIGLTNELDHWTESEVCSIEDYDANVRCTVKVKNLMSGAEVEIDINDRGGCCDPSTERYWTM